MAHFSFKLNRKRMIFKVQTFDFGKVTFAVIRFLVLAPNSLLGWALMHFWIIVLV